MTRRRYVMPAIAVLVVAACGSGDGGASTAARSGLTAAVGTSPPATAETDNVAQASNLTFFVISHGIPGPQWSIFQRGAEQAGRDLGVTVRYLSSAGSARQQLQLIEEAIAQRPAG